MLSSPVSSYCCVELYNTCPGLLTVVSFIDAELIFFKISMVVINNKEQQGQPVQYVTHTEILNWSRRSQFSTPYAMKSPPYPPFPQTQTHAVGRQKRLADGCRLQANITSPPWGCTTITADLSDTRTESDE